MNIAFALSAVVAVAATVMMITRRNAVHALLYFVVSLLASAVIMFALGAAFVAALEVIVYAGAIMVLFVFVIMLIGPDTTIVRGTAWIGPSILSLVLLAAPARGGGAEPTPGDCDRLWRDTRSLCEEA